MKRENKIESIVSNLDNVGDRDKVVNGIPPTNRWADGTNEPRVGAILEVLCRSPAKRLARAFSRGRVHSK